MSDHSIFRKTSLDRISSPDQLNDYIKIYNPSIWFILAAILILLVGTCIWGIFGGIESSIGSVAVVKNGIATCYLPTENISAITLGMPVRCEDELGTVIEVSPSPIQIDADFNSYALHLSKLKTGEWVLPVTASLSVPDGVYMVKIVTETISPLSFVLN